MEKTFHKMTLKNGTEVELFDYVTGDEARRMGVMSKMAKTVDDELASQDEIIKACVKSIGGVTTGIVELAKNLNSTEYIQIIEEAGKIFQGDLEQKKS